MTLGWRIVVVVALLVLTVPTLASGFDRMHAIGQSAPSLPVVFAGPGTYRAQAQAALRRGDATAAAKAARAYISVAPVDPAASALLGALAIQRQDLNASERAFNVSGQLGWRDALTQAFLFQQAERNGEAQIMAERADALLRTGQPFGRVAAALERVEALPRGPEALAIRLSNTPNWAWDYVAQGSQLSPVRLERRLRILARARAMGMVFDCRWANDVAEKLTQQGRGAEGYRLWTRSRCGGGGVNNLGSDAGRFSEPVWDDQPQAFGWTLSSSPEARARIDAAPDGTAGNALFVSGEGAKRVPVAKRIVLLPAGEHQITWRQVGVPGEAPLRIDLAATCLGSEQAISTNPVAASAAGRRAVSLVVPSKGCDTQQLQFDATPTSNFTKQVWISDLVLDH